MNNDERTGAEPCNQAVAVIQGLNRTFGRKRALIDVDLTIPRGEVFGLVGANGAGKTTLLKHLLGLLRAEWGEVRVFGMDPVKKPVEVLGRIGFLSEDRDLPGWMRVGELLRYSAAFYPKWNMEYAEELRAKFQLDPDAKVKHLSRGELAKAGLLVAIAHRPELLILDEPSSGLDPIVRRELLEAIVRTVAEEGRTVIFSSHLLDEVERVSDRVALMSEGRIVLQGRLSDILETHHRLVVRFEASMSSAPLLAGALHVTGQGSEWTVLCNGRRDDLERELTSQGGRIVEEGAASLDEIFVARVNCKTATAAQEVVL